MAECIVMLLGQVAMALRQEHGIIGSVVGIFKQRMFYPTSNLDISMVNELAKMAAKTGVRKEGGERERERERLLNYTTTGQLCS